MANVGLHSAASGVISYQMALDVTANNIANVNTNGFKSSRASFSDLLYTERNNNEKTQTGHGARVSKTDLMFEQSAVRSTGDRLDFAALDEGFFAVQDLYGNLRFTKDGNFNITQTDADANIWELCDSSGGFVLDYDGNRIIVPFIDGTDSIDYDSLGAMVGVFTFENPYGLDQVGSNYYEATLSSGEAFISPEVTKKQGFLEASSTNIATEMTKVIEFQRAFQLNISMIKIHDELGNTVNNLRG